MTLTIPYKLTQGKELVIIPMDEYEELTELRQIYEFKPSGEIKKTLEKARINRKKGQVLTLHEIKNNLGLTD